MNTPVTSVAAWSPEQAALQRLAATRARLGRAAGLTARGNTDTDIDSIANANANANAGTGGPVLSPASPGPLAQWASQGVIALLAERWRQSPWRLSLQLADQTADTLLRPLAQRHPVGLVLAAGAAGGLFMRVRPWRWLPATSLLALWPLAGRAIAQAALESASGQRPVTGRASDGHTP